LSSAAGCKASSVGMDRQIQGGFQWRGGGSGTRCKVPNLRITGNRDLRVEFGDPT
jgi:hypothetical protein